MRPAAALALGLGLGLSLWAAKPTGKPAPAPQKPHARNYVIGIGDVLDVDVWQSKEASKVVPVRPDGKISLPLAGEIRANGRTPARLQQRIAAKLSRFMDHPSVTVIVQQVGSRFFSIMGQVQKPGQFPLLTPTWLLQALAEAGGFTPFANRGGILLIRVTAKGQQLRYKVNYNDIINGSKPFENFRLKPGDTIVVP